MQNHPNGAKSYDTSAHKANGSWKYFSPHQLSPHHTSSHIMIHIKQVKLMKKWPPSCRITKERVSFVCVQTRRAVVQTWSLSILVFYLFAHILTLLRTIFMIQARNSMPGAFGLYIFPIYCGNNTVQIVITLCTDPLDYINGFIQI